MQGQRAGGSPRRREGPGAGPSGPPGRSETGSQVSREFPLRSPSSASPTRPELGHARPARASHQLPGPQALALTSLWGALPASLAHLSLPLWACVSLASLYPSSENCSADCVSGTPSGTRLDSAPREAGIRSIFQALRAWVAMPLGPRASIR